MSEELTIQKCPCCGSAMISRVDMSEDVAGIVRDNLECDDCRAEFSGIYQLIDVEVTSEATPEPSARLPEQSGGQA